MSSLLGLFGNSVRTKLTRYSNSRTKLTRYCMQGDQLRRLHPEQSLLDSPTEYPVYSLKLKQLLLDNMTSRSRGKETAATKAESVASEADSSTGLSSRLDRVRITGEAAEDIVNGNAAPAPAPANTDGNGNKPAKRSNIKEKTIVVKDKAPSNKTSEVFFIFYFERKVINFTPTTHCLI